MEQALLIGLFLPLVGFVLLMSLSFKISRKMTSLIGCGSVFIAFISFAYLLHFNNAELNVTLFSWIPVKGLSAPFSLHLDPLSVQMALVITGVGFLIHWYATGYMEHDACFARFFACLNLFVFAMLLLVLAGNFPLLFVGWEGVGLASYLLIGFWHEREVAAKASVKAFVVNRIGDLGFILGMLLTFYIFGTGVIADVEHLALQKFQQGDVMITLITLLFFVGAIGKSAQMPLHIWLADAMAGPTPVSALIHAATMVTAGVYLLVRMNLLYILAPLTLQIVGGVGAATALFAAFAALGQTDLKKALAYSTVSQLGFMFLACGATAFYSAMFHLTSHAFIKALLFLSAGNVLHMLQGTTEMGKMGGLSKYMPKTRWLFFIGVIALSGIPPLSGFFSKDLILDQEHLQGFDVLYGIALCASTLTSIYLMRAYTLTFCGECHLTDNLKKDVKEAPNRMLIPVAILAILAIFGGLLGYGFGKTSILEENLTNISLNTAENEIVHSNLMTSATLIAVICSLGGLLVGKVLYAKVFKRSEDTPLLLTRTFYFEEMLWKLFGYPVVLLGNGILHALEIKVVKRAVVILGKMCDTVAGAMQRMQSGQIRSYAAWMVAGAALLFVYISL